MTVNRLKVKLKNQFDNENKTYLIMPIMMYCLKYVVSWKADKEIVLCDQLIISPNVLSIGLFPSRFE